MKVADVEINKLSGPYSFALLIPKPKLFKFLNKTYVQPLIILGDKHHSQDEMCENCQKDNTCFSTVQDDWFLLLDQISSYEYPIDYYIEVGLKYKQLHDSSKESIQYKSDVQTDSTSDVSVMHYIIREHFDCFIDNYMKCFTKNIRYHAIDVRNVAFKTRCIETKINDNINKILTTYSLKIKVENCDLIKLTKLACTNWKQFSIQLITQVFENQNQSCIYKQTLKQVNQDINWKQFCVNYYEFCYQYLLEAEPQIKNIQKEIHQLIDDLPDDIDCFKMLQQKLSLEIVLPNRIRRSDSQNNLIEHFCRKMFSPLLDIYFMLRLWKQVDITVSNRNHNPSWLSILNAGNIHTDRIIYFLVRKTQLYDFPPDYTDCNGIIGRSQTEFTQHALSIYKSPFQRCHELSICNLSLDQYNPNKSQIELIKYRMKIMYQHNIRMLLKGDYVYESEVDNIIDFYIKYVQEKTDKETKKQIKKKLKLNYLSPKTII